MPKGYEDVPRSPIIYAPYREAAPRFGFWGKVWGSKYHLIDYGVFSDKWDAAYNVNKPTAYILIGAKGFRYACSKSTHGVWLSTRLKRGGVGMLRRRNQICKHCWLILMRRLTEDGTLARLGYEYHWGQLRKLAPKTEEINDLERQEKSMREAGEVPWYDL